MFIHSLESNKLFAKRRRLLQWKPWVGCRESVWGGKPLDTPTPEQKQAVIDQWMDYRNSSNVPAHVQKFSKAEQHFALNPEELVDEEFPDLDDPKQDEDYEMLFSNAFFHLFIRT